MKRQKEFDLGEGDGVCWDTDYGVVTVRVLEFDEKTETTLLEIDGPPELSIVVDDRVIDMWGAPKCKGLPRFWYFFAFILRHSVRHEVFLPTFNEFLEDYLLAQRQCRTWRERMWVRIAFSARTAGMICECIKCQCSFNPGNFMRRAVSLLAVVSRFWK